MIEEYSEKVYQLYDSQGNVVFVSRSLEETLAEGIVSFKKDKKPVFVYIYTVQKEKFFTIGGE